MIIARLDGTDVIIALDGKIAASISSLTSFRDRDAAAAMSALRRLRVLRERSALPPIATE